MPMLSLGGRSEVVFMLIGTYVRRFEKQKRWRNILQSGQE